jgi:biotin carboxyl carrier protein
MLKVTVHSSKSSSSDSSEPEPSVFEIAQEKDHWLLDNEVFAGDVAQLGPNHFHVLWKDRSFNIEVVEHSPAEKTTTIRINGHLITTTARDRFDLLLESMGMEKTLSTKINEIKAPMPGLIQSVAVQVGDTVQKGDTLLVLVAMKMENTIKSPGEGTVKSVRVEPGNGVEKNQVLIEFV